MDKRGKGRFDLTPGIAVDGFEKDICRGFDEIYRKIQESVDHLAKDKTTVVVEYYPGVHRELGEQLRRGLGAEHFFLSDEIYIPLDQAESKISRDLTQDRVRGVMSTYRLEEFADGEKLAALRGEAAAVSEGLVLICGVGAYLIAEPDILIYAELTRWEIQKRYRRKELANLFGDNYGEDFLRMYKRAFFFDWRMGDRKKRELYHKADFFLDANRPDAPVLIPARAAEAALDLCVSRPFRLVPYYDAGPWGGQWMKEQFGLDKDSDNFAWSFDGVPEENSLIFRFGDAAYEMPAINVVHMRPTELLGAKTEARFGAEFPIRFDMLDTMGGGNLSLQVHPTTDFIRESYGMSYTQDESYYILEAEDDASVYLGVKEGTELSELIGALRESQSTGREFDAEKYINRFPAGKHDHFMIPGGTIHCSGKNTMVLEISATPYIFTFKLWDWNRNGLDGRPRPVHIDEGEQVIDMTRDRDRILSDGFINPLEPVAEGQGWREERTGLHELEFIETRRHWFTGTVPHDTEGTVHVLNLVQGDEVIVESPSGAFDPMRIHYAETFIVPAGAGEYTIRPAAGRPAQEFATIKAFVRGTRRNRREEK
ncbi:class I mannose-6-phosphate isomerase [Spirochaeta isovalerica]|uniref:Mannose-6-phosphate isomerase class I n=1 Tax=Spirochaeta isovalerica TaxID=150 RepID=A0A841R9N3_9SPIO|nr:class I mannose-6-phosphate isomerase [Spirochaeta isovalerica]MBB6479937.1 mannose-6-phosphate isomerase class I [Spirochaeta isovalerica]